MSNVKGKASDGAHSTVRKALGFHMQGESTDTSWGVMDVFVHTDFPDIRKKAIIKSSHGSVILIPREGDQLVRFYVELPRSVDALHLEHLKRRVSQIFQPYQINVVEAAWWSTYSIGQRLADRFHDDMRVFLAGDACHTHSPKAGQGMNVSLQDGYNIGWKLGQVLAGRAPERLLETYVLERQDTAAKLIEFDRAFTKLVSSSSAVDKQEEQGAAEDDQQPTTSGDQNTKTATTPAERFRDQFLAAGRYTSGLATRYPASAITRARGSASIGFACDEARGITIGMRFPSARVLRLSDGKPMQLAQALPSDGRWHVVVFCRQDIWFHGLHVVAAQLATTFQAYTPAGSDDDAVINSVLVLSKLPAAQSAPLNLLPLFYPPQGRLKLKSMTSHVIFSLFQDANCCIGYNKVFVDSVNVHAHGWGEAFHLYGIAPTSSVIAIVRPDLCKIPQVFCFELPLIRMTDVAEVCDLNDSARMARFFKDCLLPGKK